MFANSKINQIMFHQYNNSLYSEWKFESFHRESRMFYRIKNVITGLYLAIDPLSGASVGYRLILTEEHQVVHSHRSSWEVVRNRNGSFSMISVYKRLSITYSYEIKTRLDLQVYANLPSQHSVSYTHLTLPTILLV